MAKIPDIEALQDTGAAPWLRGWLDNLRTVVRMREPSATTIGNPLDKFVSRRELAGLGLIKSGTQGFKGGPVGGVVFSSAEAGAVGNAPGGGATSADTLIHTISYTNTSDAPQVLIVDGSITNARLTWGSSMPASGNVVLSLEWSAASGSGSVVLCDRWPNSSVTSHTACIGGCRAIKLAAGQAVKANLRARVTHSSDAMINFSSSILLARPAAPV